jgi:VWFA-related protein
VFAQEQPQGRLVKLNIVAVDSHGDPIADLGPDDFQLHDQNKQYKIAFFHKNDAKAQAQAPAALGPHEFSNRASLAPPSVTLILLDLVNLAMKDQGYARNQLASVLQKLESTDYVYLYLLTVRGPLPVRPLPDAQVTAPAGAPSENWAKDVPQMLEEAFGRVNRMTPDMYTQDRVNLTYMALESLASRLAAFPGRKSIVWISHGVPIDVGARDAIGKGTVVDFQPLLRQFSATVDSATISVYPVGDLGTRGPEQEKNLGAFNTENNTATPVARNAGPQPQKQLDVTGGGLDTMTQMAQMTGGRVHLNNDIGAAVRQAAEDARLNYTIGYYAVEWDNKFHKIHLNCSRHGVKILVKEGYYAYAGATAEQQKAAIEAAAWSPLDAGEIGIRAVVSPSQKVARGVHLQIKLDANDIEMTHQQERFAGQVAVTYVSYDADGHPTQAPATAFPFKMTAQQHDGALKDGMALSQDRAVPDSTRKIRVIVFDDTANTVGSLTIPIAPEDRGPQQ